jgi:hypothetical protein
MILTSLKAYADNNHSNCVSWTSRSLPIAARDIETDVPFALCRCPLLVSGRDRRKIPALTLMIIAKVQVDTRITDFNVVLLRSGMTGAINAVERDFMSCVSSVVGVMSEDMWSMPPLELRRLEGFI